MAWRRLNHIASSAPWLLPWLPHVQDFAPQQWWHSASPANPSCGQKTREGTGALITNVRITSGATAELQSKTGVYRSILILGYPFSIAGSCQVFVADPTQRLFLALLATRCSRAGLQVTKAKSLMPLQREIQL